MFSKNSVHDVLTVSQCFNCFGDRDLGGREVDTECDCNTEAIKIILFVLNKSNIKYHCSRILYTNQYLSKTAKPSELPFRGEWN